MDLASLWIAMSAEEGLAFRKTLEVELAVFTRKLLEENMLRGLS